MTGVEGKVRAREGCKEKGPDDGKSRVSLQRNQDTVNGTMGVTLYKLCGGYLCVV